MTGVKSRSYIRIALTDNRLCKTAKYGDIFGHVSHISEKQEYKQHIVNIIHNQGTTVLFKFKKL